MFTLQFFTTVGLALNLTWPDLNIRKISSITATNILLKKISDGFLETRSLYFLIVVIDINNSPYLSFRIINNEKVIFQLRYLYHDQTRQSVNVMSCDFSATYCIHLVINL